MLTLGSWAKKSSFVGRDVYVDTWRPIASTAVARLVPVRPHLLQIGGQPGPKGRDGSTERQHGQELGFHLKKIEIVF